MLKHIFKTGSMDKPTLLLLHGTGGNEHSLLPLAERINPELSVLAVRGNVLENGMPRFFRRLAEGVFDMEDLVNRTKELHEFLNQAAGEYGFDRERIIAMGYSNGANIAASLLFHYGSVLQGAILHHPMVPRRDITVPMLSQTPIFIAAGTNDPMCPREETDDLAHLLQEAGASLTVHWESNGHQLTSTEIDAAAAWFRENFA